MTPEERMARAESVAQDFERHGVGQEIAAVLRGLVHDLRNEQQRVISLQHELDHVAPTTECERVRDLERQLADLRAQVVSALSAAGPGEDERSA